MLIDSHCHINMLDLALFGGTVQGVIDEAKKFGVEHMLCVSVEIAAFPTLLAMAQTYSAISISFGVHPNEPEENELSAEGIAELAKNPHVVAIGETGLDYYRSEGDVEWQRERFRNHIRAAKFTKKPLIVHTRQAQADTMQILQEEGASEVGGVMHCFTETWDMAKKAMDLGFYISFAGIVTFKNAVQLKELAKKVPLDRILVETDAPYLTPDPFRGKPNHPGYVKYVAQHIAELRNQTFAEIAEATTHNYFKLFGGLPL